MLPKEVMLQAQQEFLNLNETGISVMEMSHRSKEYLPIVEKAEKSLRTLLKIPNNYKVLFLQGGAITQNFMVPMNLLNSGQQAMLFQDIGQRELIMMPNLLAQ